MRATLDQRFLDDQAGDDVDLNAARRWVRTMRRVHHVEFTGRDGVAIVHGIGHRLPVSRRVPARVGRGLVALGYPATERQAT